MGQKRNLVFLARFFSQNPVPFRKKAEGSEEL